MIRLLHTADLHARRDKMPETLKSIDAIRQTAVDRQVDLIAITGDIWNSAYLNTGDFAEFIESVRALADVAPVAMVYGTPTHDAYGSLEVFEKLHSDFGITILKPGTTYYLDSTGIESEEDLEGYMPEAKAILFGIPEPNKSWLLANKNGLSRDEATEAMQVELRKLFLGLAAVRKEHSDIPAVVLYHGQIRGAKLQNGGTMDQGVTKDDLAMIGADYYALGDIHEPQQIGNLPMYYSGSIVPQNWGETHQAGVNLVELTGWGRDYLDKPNENGVLSFEPSYKINVERIDLPQPKNQKISAVAIRDLQGIDIGEHEPITRGARVWLDITCTSEQAAQMDMELFEGRLKLQGAIEGSKVTLNILPTETVRAAGIVEAQRLRDKVDVWAENSSLTVDDETREMADRLEAECAQSGAAAKGLHIRIDRLVLRGAIGIWKGQHVDEIDLDMSRFDEDLVALVGANGEGKTTLIENMHPYPSLFARDGKLQDHFRLKDSRRELWFTDVRTGDQYRALLLIDGKNASGSVEYHLYKNGAPVPGDNGRKEPYETSITELFGSQALFLRSAFVSQRSTKGNPDLSDATKGERKALFLELSGLEHYQAYSLAAREHAKSIDAAISSSRTRIEVLRETVAHAPDLEAIRAELDGAIADAKAQLAEIEQQGKTARAELEAATAKADQQRQIKRQIEETKELWEAVGMKAVDLSVDRKVYETAVAGREAAEKEIEAYGELEAEQEQLQQEYNQYLEAERSRMAEYDAERESCQAYADSLQEKLKAAQKTYSDLNAQAGKLDAAIELIEPQIQHEPNDTCPHCQGKLPWAEKDRLRFDDLCLQFDRARLQRKELSVPLNSASNELANIARQIQEIAWPTKPDPEPFDDKRLRSLKAQIELSDIDEKREIVEKAKEAAAKIASIDERIAELRAEQQKHEAKAKELEATYDQTAEQAAKLAKDLHEEMVAQYTEEKQTIARFETEKSSVEKQVDEIRETKEKVVHLESEISQQSAELTRWQFLEKACGPDGIQALELENLAPSIEHEANELLKAAYGSRFSVQFRLTREAGKGSKAKQVEDFLIQVYDSENSTDQDLSTLSGGERVWIIRAIYDAFGVIRARNTGTKFLTVFQDETDGALDPEAKDAYFRMLEAAHRQSGRVHTIVITHSEVIQQLIEQRIVMRDLARAKHEATV